MNDTKPRPLEGMGRHIATLVMDLVVPIVGYYVLRSIGLDPVLALILAGMPITAMVCYRAVRQRRVDALGIFVLVVLTGSVTLTLVTGSPRFMLAKDGWFTAAIAIGFLCTLWLRRPLAYTLARAILRPTPMGKTFRTETWDQRWETDPAFRRPWRVATVMWGVTMLADAIVRVVMAYTLPVDSVPALDGALWAITFVSVQVLQHYYFHRVGLWESLRRQPENTPMPACA